MRGYGPAWPNGSMSEIRDVYLTAAGAYLPGDPLDNDEIARRLGCPDGAGRAARDRVLAANGIRTRHYALDERGQPTMLNEELAAAAVTLALKDRGRSADELTMLATGTTQGDLIVPGFASMVHGRLGGGPMELLSAGGVCASSMAALRAAAAAVRLGEHDVAVAVGSELVSRALRQSRYQVAGPRVRFDAEFLRWTLSDGAGAVLLEPAPRPDRVSLRLDWMHLTSHAHEHQVCMSAGLADGGRSTTRGSTTVDAGGTWMDQPDASAADRAGMLLLRQDVAALPALFGVGLREFAGLVRQGRFNPTEIDHVLCHYSAEHFRGEIFALLRDADLMIPEERWFTNLHTSGNTGAASIFVMLHEAMAQGRFAPGDRILLIVPESGRFSFAFAHLTCVGPNQPAAPMPAPVTEAAPSPLGQPRSEDGDVTRWAVLQLAAVWDDFEARLARVPLVRRIEAGTATVEDYRRLLRQLRQQVVEGGRWIARAASNFSVELFELRSAAIHHAAEEHRDFRMLERDYCAVGGELADIQGGSKNVGSEALSGYLFHQASQPDPVDLLGAMFIIEGLGTAKVSGWAARLQDSLGLTPDQITFLSYHGEADDGHFEILRQILRSTVVDRAAAERIVRTASVVARLYAMQLEAVDEEVGR
jgi:3-oxoacyl-[acyl-carrier-protein] synthase III